MIADLEEVAPDRLPIRPSVKSDAVFATEVSKGSAQLTPKNCLRCLVCKDYLRSCFPDSRDPAPWEDDEAFR